LDARVIEREVDRRQNAPGVGIRHLAGLVAEPVDAVLVVLALLVLAALLRLLAGAAGARPAGTALVVGRARLAGAGLAHAAGLLQLTVRVAFTFGGDHTRIRLAAFPLLTLGIFGAFNAFVRGAMTSLAILIALALLARFVAAAAGERKPEAHGEGRDEHGSAGSDSRQAAGSSHGVEPKCLRHVSQFSAAIW